MLAGDHVHQVSVCPVTFDVLAGNGEGVLRNVGGEDFCGRRFDGHGDSETTAAGAEIEGGRSVIGGEKVEKIPGAFGEKFGFWTRDEDATVDDHFQPAK